MQGFHVPSDFGASASLRKARKRNKLEGRQESTSDMELDEDVSHPSATKRHRKKKPSLLTVLASREVAPRKRDR